jgi:hypothetical protein
MHKHYAKEQDICFDDNHVILKQIWSPENRTILVTIKLSYVIRGAKMMNESNFKYVKYLNIIYAIHFF